MTNELIVIKRALVTSHSQFYLGTILLIVSMSDINIFNKSWLSAFDTMLPPVLLRNGLGAGA